MAWYIDTDANAPTWQRRAAITVLNYGGIAGTFDVEIVIPATWEAFWSVIDDDGFNIRVTAADGVNDLPYDIDDGSGGAFNAAAVAARTGRIRIDGTVCEAATIHLLWVYYEPTATATDGSSVVVIAAPIDGVIEHDGPGSRQYIYAQQSPRSSNPRDVTHKAEDEAVDLWIRLDLALSKLQRASQNSRAFEEAYAHTMSVIDTAGADQAAMYSLSANRFVWVDRNQGELWLMVEVQAGTDDTLYTAIPEVKTLVPVGSTAIARQVFEPRIGISVRNTRFE